MAAATTTWPAPSAYRSRDVRYKGVAGPARSSGQARQVSNRNTSETPTTRAASKPCTQVAHAGALHRGRTARLRRNGDRSAAGLRGPSGSLEQAAALLHAMRPGRVWYPAERRLAGCGAGATTASGTARPDCATRRGRDGAEHSAMPAAGCRGLAGSKSKPLTASLEVKSGASERRVQAGADRLHGHHRGAHLR